MQQQHKFPLVARVRHSVEVSTRDFDRVTRLSLLGKTSRDSSSTLGASFLDRIAACNGACAIFSIFEHLHRDLRLLKRPWLEHRPRRASALCVDHSRHPVDCPRQERAPGGSKPQSVLGGYSTGTAGAPNITRTPHKALEPVNIAMRIVSASSRASHCLPGVSRNPSSGRPHQSTGAFQSFQYILRLSETQHCSHYQHGILLMGGAVRTTYFSGVTLPSLSPRRVSILDRDWIQGRIGKDEGMWS